MNPSGQKFSSFTEEKEVRDKWAEEFKNDILPEILKKCTVYSALSTSAVDRECYLIMSKDHGRMAYFPRMDELYWYEKKKMITDGLRFIEAKILSSSDQ